MILQARIPEWVAVPFCRSSQPRDQTQVSHTAGLPAESPGKPKNTGVGSLSLLHGIFLTQEIKLGSPALQANSLPAELPGKPILYLPLISVILTTMCLGVFLSG